MVKSNNAYKLKVSKFIIFMKHRTNHNGITVNYMKVLHNLEIVFIKYFVF